MDLKLIKGSLRTATPPADLETVTMADVAKAINPVNVRLVNHNASGNTYLHLIDKNDEYLSIKVSKKCNLEGEDDASKMAELVKGFTIYTGDTNINGEPTERWFTFAPEASDRPTVVVSFADLMKAGKFAKA